MQPVPISPTRLAPHRPCRGGGAGICRRRAGWLWMQHGLAVYVAQLRTVCGGIASVSVFNQTNIFPLISVINHLLFRALLSVIAHCVFQCTHRGTTMRVAWNASLRRWHCCGLRLCARARCGRSNRLRQAPGTGGGGQGCRQDRRPARRAGPRRQPGRQCDAAQDTRKPPPSPAASRGKPLPPMVMNDEPVHLSSITIITGSNRKDSAIDCGLGNPCVSRAAVA